MADQLDSQDVKAGVIAALVHRRDSRRAGELPRTVSAIALAKRFGIRVGGSRDSRRRGVRNVIKALREDGVQVLSRGDGYYLGVEPADYEAAMQFAKRNGLGELARAAAIRHSDGSPTPAAS